MSQVDEKLVQTIADLVIAAIQKQSQGSARISPPAGLCTAGDSPNTNPAPSVVRPVTTSMQYDAANTTPSMDGTPLAGIITANQLADAIKASPNNLVVLAGDAKLTPLAQDLVRAKPECVKRQNVSAEDANLKSLNHGLPWSWWSCCQCESVRRIIAERSGAMIPLTVPRRPVSDAEAVMDADTAVRSGRSAGAVLFVKQAARAMCLANRRRSLRAILGNCDEAVAMGVHEIGANVLVLEFPYLTYEEMSARVDIVMRSEARPSGEMLRLLREVEGRG